LAACDTRGIVRTRNQGSIVVAVAACSLWCAACSDSSELAAAGHPDGAKPSSRDSGGKTDGSHVSTKDASLGPTKDASPPSRDASLEGRAAPPFGFAERPSNTSCVAPKRPTGAIAVSLVRAFPSLPYVPQPLGFLQAPNDSSRWFIFTQRGIVHAVSNTPDVAAVTPFLNIQSRVNSGPDEAGLLGMAFDPNFATTGVAYLSYTGYGGMVNVMSRVSRFVSRDGGKTLDPSSEEVLLQVEQPFLNHNGGNLAFGPDGLLYLGLGDGGGAGDPLGYGLNRDALLGKVLRIGVTPTGPYSIPATNPFANGGGKPEIYAMGFRNPWRWSFDRDTGDLWLGDVGQGRREEVDRVKRGGNYGWNLLEGTFCRNADCPWGGMIFPVAEYTHDDGLAIVGGYVYRGSAIPALAGTYIYGDYAHRTIWALTRDPMSGAVSPTVIATAPAQISSFGEGVDGELYVVLYTGYVLKLVPAAASDAAIAGGALPATLSATGCTDAGDPTKFSKGVIPYDVNIPYWSDGIEMSRGVAIPDGTKIKLLPDGRFDLPNGSVLLQTASRGGRRLHTKFLVRHDDGDWSGYAYEWNQAQTDATLVRGAKVVKDGTFGSYVTQPGECLACHKSESGRVLGFSSPQLNRDVSYANGARLNQLSQLEHIGYFDAPLPASTKADPYPSIEGPAPVDARARAYLEVNCAMCHDPSIGPGAGSTDLRLETSVAAMGLCNAPPERGQLGVPGAPLVAPGSPARSILSLRMHTDDWSRMPPLESQVADEKGAALVDEWITSAVKCPAPRDAGGG
jgi:uncharacterized repeat protein (TIGR03806 family)